MKKIILLSAKAQNGKDSTALIMKKHLEENGERVVIMSFAYYIKSYLQRFYGWNGEKDEYWRTKLQYLGTEKIRDGLNMPNFHVQRVCEDIKILEDEFDYFVLSDTRFHNEIDYTKAYFPRQVIDLRIKRLNFESPLTEEQQNHKSEIDLDDYKFYDIIESEGGLNKLETEVVDFLEKEGLIV